MVKFTQDMKDIVEKARPFIMATANKDGEPNGVPIGLVKIISDDEIMLVDCYMNKSRQNIVENPMVAVTGWNLDVGYGYQFKGKTRVETSGKTFDEAIEWLKTRSPKSHPKAVVVVKVEKAYYIGTEKDSSKNLF